MKQKREILKTLVSLAPCQRIEVVASIFSGQYDTWSEEPVSLAIGPRGGLRVRDHNDEDVFSPGLPRWMYGRMYDNITEAVKATARGEIQ